MSIVGRSTLNMATVVLLALLASLAQAQSVQSGEMEDILKIVSADVQKNFYDPHMKGLDWPALTEEARRNIRASTNMGKMILAIVAMLDKLDDSHTYFIPPRLTQRADFGFSARPYGNDVRVYEIGNKGPAAKAGLELGDKIISLNGIPVGRNNFSEIFLLLQAVVPATTLDAEVLATTGQVHLMHIPAHMIVTQEHQYLDSVWRVADQQRARDVHVAFKHKDYGDGLTYVGIPSFHSMPAETLSAVKKAEHARALILDLRGNHGGFMDSLVEFLAFFSQKPGVLAKRVGRSKSEDLEVKPQYSGFNGTIIVLVDSDSASAAELAARHLQSNYKAHVVGDRTSGKVNEGHLIIDKIGARFVLPFGVVVTDAKLVMPDGEELEGHGVIPDSVCIPTPEDLREKRDPCLDQAVTLAKKAIAGNPAKAN